jgi:hypothetical protein
MNILENIFYDFSKKYVYIYHILLENGRGYIGSTNNPKARVLNHLSEIKKGTHRNYKLIDELKNNKISTIDIVAKCPILYRNSLEMWFIQKSSLNSECNIMAYCDVKSHINKKHFISVENINNIFIDRLNYKSITELSEKYKIKINTIKGILRGQISSYISFPLKEKYNKDLKKINNYFISLAKKEIYKKTYVYTICGKFLGEYSSITAAAKELGLNRNAVGNALYKNIRYKNYKFFYSKQDNFVNYTTTPSNLRKIYKIDNNFNIQKIYSKMIQCAEENQISYNYLNTICNRMNIHKDNFFYIKENKMEKFKIKYNDVLKLSTDLLIVDHYIGDMLNKGN